MIASALSLKAEREVPLFNRGAEAAEIVVQADAVALRLDAVQRTSAARVEGERANAERRL